MSELGIGSNLTPMLRNKVLGESAGASPLEKGMGSIGPQKGPSSAEFLESLDSAINETNHALKQADQMASDFAAGKAKNLHDVTIAMEKADLSLRTLTAVRGKVLEAYQEIMRMQV